ncbi:LLM class flavin-dependent oxidoreductase [Actinomadura rayongensis]|uniref:LLM class flavin-dependent oxidoreductase n=1 Tax=Actinomadura rayongensis TaxID=1429076 RepID=A0A6I4WB17_9ACTN|nr:LLM class flavin-dependent oxidoreductase [Actinomadura rayongensis]MXQ68109.1 LLM class flavin-dependent oxidoreductase [Actinomadura rayongensis]
MSGSRLFLAVDLDGDGAHPAAWRHSGRPPGSVLTPQALRASVSAAETAGFTLATFADTPVPPGDGPTPAGRIEAGTRAAFVSTTTDRIGLAPTLHVTTTEPFHLATQLASLDHASNGRAGWVVGAAGDEASLATIGATAPDAAALRREVLDVVDAARLLWDSWEDDAVIKESRTGRYLDADRVHHVDFEGATFTVKGPLITPRPPQGQVVVLAPAALDVDDRADIVLVDGPDAEDREALAFAEVEIVLGTTTAQAEERAARLDADAAWPRSRRLRHVGTPDGLVELLRSLAVTFDGVRLHPAVLATEFELLISDVLPVLADEGLFRPPAPGATLRDSLGLPRPANRFAAAS